MKLLNKVVDYASCREGAFVWYSTFILLKYQPVESFWYKYAPIGAFALHDKIDSSISVTIPKWMR